MHLLCNCSPEPTLAPRVVYPHLPPLRAALRREQAVQELDLRPQRFLLLRHRHLQHLLQPPHDLGVALLLCLRRVEVKVSGSRAR